MSKQQLSMSVEQMLNIIPQDQHESFMQMLHWAMSNGWAHLSLWTGYVDGVENPDQSDLFGVPPHSRFGEFVVKYYGVTK